jgi:hypothetical protein
MNDFDRFELLHGPSSALRGNPGRQYWPSRWSAILTGSGIRAGAVHRKTDKTSSYAKDSPVSVRYLGATIFHALRMPGDQRLGKNGFTRPVSADDPLLELF